MSCRNFPPPLVGVQTGDMGNTRSGTWVTHLNGMSRVIRGGGHAMVRGGYRVSATWGGEDLVDSAVLWTNDES